MVKNQVLTTQDFCEMTVVPGGIIEYARGQTATKILTDLNAPIHDKIPFVGERQFSFSPIKIDALNRSIQLTNKPLSYEYKTDIMNFQSAYTSLLYFLKKFAFTYEQSGNCCTTLFFDEISSHLLAFSSIKCSSLKMKGDKLIHLCPSIELMALCVDDRYRYMGIGQAILNHIMQQLYTIRSLVGAQLLTLFALPDAVAFYQKFNFCPLTKDMKLFHSPAHKHCVPMYLSLPRIPLKQ